MRIYICIFFIIMMFSCKNKEKLNVYNFSSKFASEEFWNIYSQKQYANTLENIKIWSNNIRGVFTRGANLTGAIQFFGELATQEQNKEFRSFFYFLLSDLYWENENREVAGFYMILVDKEIYSQTYNYRFLGYYIAKRMIKTNSSFKIKEEMYNILLTDYKDLIDVPYTLFELSKLYKKELEIKKAVDVMQELLRGAYHYGNIDNNINLGTLRKEIRFYKSKKRWIYEDLNDLITEIKELIKRKNLRLLYACIPDRGFRIKCFQRNSGINWTLNELQIQKRWTNRIIFADKSEEFSNDSEVYLKTTNWNFPNMRTWYLYFKRIDYPYDNNINRGWEWSGVYFGNPI